MNPGVYSEFLTIMKANWKTAFESGCFVENDKIVHNVLDPSCSLTLTYFFIAVPQACMVTFI